MHLSPPATLLAVLLTAAAGCRDDPASLRATPPPTAEFIIAAGDSAYWVSTVGTSLRMRGAPLELAQVDGRFYEVYLVDDDRSYEDAVLVGERIYRRDLLSGDSVVVYQDTLIPSLAREYARLHPDDRRLGPDEEASEEPLWRATSTLELGAMHGRFASYSLHTDVERGDGPLWHTSRTGVIDLRERRAATLFDLADGAVDRVERLRDAELRMALDSVRASRDARGTRAAATLGHYRLDPTSFELTTVEGRPAVAYALSGAGVGDAGHMLPLTPILIGEPTWWREVLPSLPVTSADGGRDVWRHRRYDVVVRYGTSGDAELAVRDSTSREWQVGRISGPAVRIFWLDDPAPDSAVRSALVKAFREAAEYDEEGRVALALTAGARARRIVWRR